MRAAIVDDSKDDLQYLYDNISEVKYARGYRRRLKR